MYFIENRKGGISVFLCIILTAMLLLTGVIVDVSRIVAAEKKIQSALNTAVRSALANYDASLIGDYGLFGLDTETDIAKLKEDFLSYLEMNISENDENFNFIKYKIVDDKSRTSLKAFGSLLSNDSFKNQVLQYMKYKAPLIISKNLIDKISSSGLTGKLKFSKNEKKVREKRKKLLTQIDSTNSKLEDIKGESEGADADALRHIKTLLEDVKKQNTLTNQYLEDYEKEKEKSEKSCGPDASEENQGINITHEESKQVQEQIDNFDKQADRNIQEIDAGIKEGIELEKKKKVLEKEKQEIDDKIKQTEEEQYGAGSGDEFKELQKKIDSLNKQLESKNEEIEGVNCELNEIAAKFKLTDMEAVTFNKADKKEEEKDPNAKNSVEALKGEFAAYLKSLDEEWLIGSAEFKNAEAADDEIYKDMELGDGDEEEREGESEDKNDDIMAYLENLFEVLGNIAESGMEKEYIVEYAMDKYTYLTSQTLRDHYFDKGEIEYILWGNKNQTVNISLTMGSIWFLRFAIDTIDSFATSPVCEPISRLITSLIKGFTLSCYDVIKLYKGQEVGICPSMKAIKLSYSDHLRIFLLLKVATNAGEVSVLNNMRQLIQVNLKQSTPNFQLKNYNTALHGKVETEINLWFLPFLQLDKLNLSNFKDGRYFITKEAYMEY